MRPGLKLSCIVCTYNREDFVLACLEKLTQQSLPPNRYEVIVVDNHSKDGTAERVKAFIQCHPGNQLSYLFEVKQGLSHARNRGGEAARGDVLTYIDDDAIADPHFLEEVLKTFERFPWAGCVGGKINLALPGRLPWWYNDRLAGYFSGFSLESASTKRISKVWELPYGANFSVSKKAFREARGFSVHLGRKGNDFSGGEETDLAYRIAASGYEIYYAPSAMVTHHIPEERMNLHHMIRSATSSARVWVYLEQELMRSNTGIRPDLMNLGKDVTKCLFFFGKNNLSRRFQFFLQALHNYEKVKSKWSEDGLRSVEGGKHFCRRRRDAFGRTACLRHRKESAVSPPLDESFLRDVQSHYRTGPRFTRAYLEYHQQSRGKAVRTLQEIQGLPGPESMWFDYALSTNDRGAELYQMVRPHVPAHARRYLDVGSGFGGCLVAFGRHGMDASGIDVDPERIEFAKSNCQDHAIPENVFQVSILEDDLERRLGRFDVITCLDVLEHVEDVPKALRHLVGLLNPGGLLCLEIPNKDSLFFVGKDGHFGLFGITLLERQEAMAYHGSFFSFPYDVGDYYALSYYLERLKAQGCRCEMIPSSLHPARPLDEIPTLFSAFFANYIVFLREQAPRLPEGLLPRIQEALAEYMGHQLKNLSNLTGGVPATEEFQKRYLTDFWTLLAHRP